jgi:hypothetical protein
LDQEAAMHVVSSLSRLRRIGRLRSAVLAVVSGSMLAAVGIGVVGVTPAQASVPATGCTNGWTIPDGIQIELSQCTIKWNKSSVSIAGSFAASPTSYFYDLSAYHNRTLLGFWNFPMTEHKTKSFSGTFGSSLANRIVWSVYNTKKQYQDEGSYQESGNGWDLVYAGYQTKPECEAAGPGVVDEYADDGAYDFYCEESPVPDFGYIYILHIVGTGKGPGSLDGDTRMPAPAQ